MGDGTAPLRECGAGVKVRVRTCVFSALPENRTDPGGAGCAHSPWRCRPRKQPSDRPCPGGGGGDKAAAAGTRRRGQGGHEAALTPGSAAALGSGSGSGCRWARAAAGLRPPAPPRPRPRPARAPGLAGVRSGAGPAGERALVLLLRRVAGPAPGLPGSGSRPRPWAWQAPRTLPSPAATRMQKLSGAGPAAQDSGAPQDPHLQACAGREGKGRGGGDLLFSVLYWAPLCQVRA